jgi:hypothetical protein
VEDVSGCFRRGMESATVRIDLKCKAQFSAILPTFIDDWLWGIDEKEASDKRERTRQYIGYFSSVPVVPLRRVQMRMPTHGAVTQIWCFDIM